MCERKTGCPQSDRVLHDQTDCDPEAQTDCDQEAHLHNQTDCDQEAHDVDRMPVTSTAAPVTLLTLFSLSRMNLAPVVCARLWNHQACTIFEIVC